MVPECIVTAVTFDWLIWMGGRGQTHLLVERVRATEEAETFTVWIVVFTADSRLDETEIQTTRDVCTDFQQYRL